jgi:hypothetical protein
LIEYNPPVIDKGLAELIPRTVIGLLTIGMEKPTPV